MAAAKIPAISKPLNPKPEGMLLAMKKGKIRSLCSITSEGSVHGAATLTKQGVSFVESMEKHSQRAWRARPKTRFLVREGRFYPVNGYLNRYENFHGFWLTDCAVRGNPRPRSSFRSVEFYTIYTKYLGVRVDEFRLAVLRSESMRKDKAFMRWCFSGCGLVLLVGMVAYAGQAREVTRSLAVEDKGVPRTPARLSSYEGPGVVYMVPTGILVISPGETVRAQSMGFNLNWDRQKIEAAMGGAVDLPHITGELEVQYDVQNRALYLWARDSETGEVFKTTIPLNNRFRSLDSAIEFLTKVGSFFEYMYSPEPPAVPPGGVVAAEECGGGSCRGSNGCSACCPAGKDPVCNSICTCVATM